MSIKYQAWVLLVRIGPMHHTYWVLVGCLHNCLMQWAVASLHIQCQIVWRVHLQNPFNTTIPNQNKLTSTYLENSSIPLSLIYQILQ